MSIANITIGALACGWPTGERNKKYFAMLRAFVDDSGNSPTQGPWYVLAGFLARVEKWETFSDRWRAALDQTPQISRFKASEAKRLKGEFDPVHGWNESLRDRRIDELLSIIEDTVDYRIMAVMRHQVFEDAIRSVPVKARHLATDHPFVWLSSRILSLTAGMTAFYYDDETSQVVFDQQDGFEDFVGKNWEATRELYKEHFKKDVMPSGPLFE